MLWQNVLNSRKMYLKFGFYDYSTNCVSWKYCRKGWFQFSEDGRLIIFGQNCLNLHNKCSQGDIAHNSVKALATMRFLEHFVAATALQPLPWCLSCPYLTHIMHHGEDSTVSYVVWLHERQYEHQIKSCVQLQQQSCPENLLVVQSL